MKTFWHLGTRWRWVVIFTPRLLYPREKSPGTHWIRGWVGPRASLEAVEMRKVLYLPGTKPGLPARRYTSWAIPTSVIPYSMVNKCQRCLGLSWLLLQGQSSSPFRNFGTYNIGVSSQKSLIVILRREPQIKWIIVYFLFQPFVDFNKAYDSVRRAYRTDNIVACYSGDYIRRVLAWQLDLLDHTQLQLQCIHFTLAVHYSTCRVSLQLQLTLTTESFQGPGPPADPTGSHWPLPNSSGLFSATHRQLTRYWNYPPWLSTPELYSPPLTVN
jgi:hypothetical protein